MIRILGINLIGIGLLLYLVHRDYWQIVTLFGSLALGLTFLRKRDARAPLRSGMVTPVSNVSKSILFFDLETTGLPKSRNKTYRDVDNWPRAVSIAWIIANNETGVTHSGYEVIKPSGFIIPPDATAIHNISHAKALATGKALSDVLSSLADDVAAARPVQVVAHNIAFDHPIISAEFLRCDISNPILELKSFCTMISTTGLCKLPGNGGDYKWPRLEELVEFLYKKKVVPRHNAMEDTLFTLLCYCELSRMRKIGQNAPLREPENLFIS